MAKVGINAIVWHEGEEKMHKLLHVPNQHNPTKPGLSAHAQRLLHISSLFALGILDDQGRPWTTLLGGQPGFARSLGQSIVGLKTVAARRYDPVLDILLRPTQTAKEAEAGNFPKDFSALGIHLATRDRIKLLGRMLAGGTVGNGSEDKGSQSDVAEIQLIFAIEGSLGNCPKYLNEKDIILTVPKPLCLSDTLPLGEVALRLLAKADMLFITSYHPSHMSTNHRGGPSGFIRVEKNDTSGVILVYPEYSGNRLYQTLGNLYLDPRAGIVVPDFDSGDVLYMTGATKILVGKDAANTLPRSNLAVQFRIDAARYVQNGLAFRGMSGERSPYNPPVRYLTTERAVPDAQSQNSGVAYAKIHSRDLLTPTIARFRFSISDPETAGRWTPGQYVALAFEDELSRGYAHMADDDPKSLNDDYVRTFTVSSPPNGELRHDEFEITIRNVGTVTGFLFGCNPCGGLEVPLRGFGGTFSVMQRDGSGTVPFVAGGIGITPLLAQLSDLETQRLRLFWTVNVRDIGLVADTLRRYPALGPSVRVYVSGISGALSDEHKAALDEVERAVSSVARRRLMEEDVGGEQGLDDTWYICTGPALRKNLLEWLKGKKTVYEDFNY
ncbi:MAG: hypothetical protein Q9217_003939 [Psora testacea]